MTDVAFSEGWLPRFYRGWKPLPQQPKKSQDAPVHGSIPVSQASNYGLIGHTVLAVAHSAGHTTL
jgi:hypothetical protein